MLFISLQGCKLFHCIFLKQKVRLFQIGVKRGLPKNKSASANYYTITVSVVCPQQDAWLLFLLLLKICIPPIMKSSIKIHHFVCTCCMCSVQRPTARKGIIIHMTERLGKTQSLFFIFLSCCMSPMSHFWNKCIVMFYAVFLFFYILNVEWFSSWAKLLTINGMSTICQNTTKTSCNMEFGFERASEGSLWRLVRGEVGVERLLSDLL